MEFPAWTRRRAPALLAAMLAIQVPSAASGQHERVSAEDVLFNWNRMVLELVRHTPTYSPPVASRAFAYLGVAAYEAAAGGTHDLQSLAGQLNALEAPPARVAGEYDEAVVMHAALSFAVENFFGNTGPTGQRAMIMMDARMSDMVTAGVPDDVLDRSRAYGQAVGEHILEWSSEDGGAHVENLGFPYEYELGNAPGDWVPTSPIALQQAPLLPDWGNNRTFAMPDGAAGPARVQRRGRHRLLPRSARGL